eukprot:3273117-Rhodomonas_salina.2
MSRGVAAVVLKEEVLKPQDVTQRQCREEENVLFREAGACINAIHAVDIYIDSTDAGNGGVLT